MNRSNRISINFKNEMNMFERTTDQVVTETHHQVEGIVHFENVDLLNEGWVGEVLG